MKLLRRGPLDFLFRHAGQLRSLCFRAPRISILSLAKDGVWANAHERRRTHPLLAKKAAHSGEVLNPARGLAADCALQHKPLRRITVDGGCPLRASGSPFMRALCAWVGSPTPFRCSGPHSPSGRRVSQARLDRQTTASRRIADSSSTIRMNPAVNLLYPV